MVGSTKDYSRNWLIGTNKKYKMKIHKLNHISHVINQTELFDIIKIPQQYNRTTIMDSGTDINLAKHQWIKRENKKEWKMKHTSQMGGNKISGGNIIYYSWNIRQSKNRTHIPVLKLWSRYVTPKLVQLWIHGWNNKRKYWHNKKTENRHTGKQKPRNSVMGYTT